MFVDVCMTFVLHLTYGCKCNRRTINQSPDDDNGDDDDDDDDVFTDF